MGGTGTALAAAALRERRGRDRILATLSVSALFELRQVSRASSSCQRQQRPRATTPSSVVILRLPLLSMPSVLALRHSRFTSSASSTNRLFKLKRPQTARAEVLDLRSEQHMLHDAAQLLGASGACGAGGCEPPNKVVNTPPLGALGSAATGTP